MSIKENYNNSLLQKVKTKDKKRKGGRKSASITDIGPESEGNKSHTPTQRTLIESYLGGKIKSSNDNFHSKKTSIKSMLDLNQYSSNRVLENGSRLSNQMPTFSIEVPKAPKESNGYHKFLK